VEVIGFIVGMAGLGFALTTMARIEKLEKRLEAAGVLKPDPDPAE
jgi:hypothetical protein